MGIKDFMMRKMMEQKLKDARLNDAVGQVPKEDQEKMITLVQKNPELFQKIALDVQEEINKGKDQMAATIEVMQKYEAELKQLL